jgi:hypothetical protein
MKDDTEYPKHFISALSTTYFFLVRTYLRRECVYIDDLPTKATNTCFLYLFL